MHLVLIKVCHRTNFKCGDLYGRGAKCNSIFLLPALLFVLALYCLLTLWRVGRAFANVYVVFQALLKNMNNTQAMKTIAIVNSAGVDGQVRLTSEMF